MARSAEAAASPKTYHMYGGMVPSFISLVRIPYHTALLRYNTYHHTPIPSPPSLPPSDTFAMSTSPGQAPTSSSSSATLATAAPPNEEALRVELRTLLGQIKKREPLEPSYRRLLLDGPVTHHKPTLPKDKFYRRVGSRLRERVEAFVTANVGKDPLDRLRHRPAFEEEKMRAALSLREFKAHEQLPLLDAYLASLLPKGMAVDERARRLARIAQGLQHTKWRKPKPPTQPAQTTTTALQAATGHAAEQAEAARQAAEKERQRQAAQAREAERRRQQQRKEEQEQRRQASLRQSTEETTPKQKVRQYCEPILRLLWNMEFQNLGGINPFRMVIDRNNCAVVGAPDYFDIIDKPMNLTWIQQKVERAEYNNLKEFFSDVELMISNALKYNSDPNNQYRIAAQKMKTEFKKAAQKLIATLKQEHKDQRGQNRG